MPRAIPSLLYSQEAAGALDTAQLRSLGTSALLELEVALASGALRAPLPAGTFAAFERSLISSAGELASISAAGVSQPRELLTSAVVARLDRVLDALLRALSLVFLHRAALKTCEYLVRVHSVHRHRPTSMLMAILPYHTTPIYARALALLAPHLPVS